MSQVEAKWIKKDIQSLEANASKELQVKVTGAIERTANGINVALGAISNAMLAGNIDDGKLAVSYIKADGSRPFTGDQSMNGHKITSLAYPTSDTDAASKIYVDTVAQGLNIKPAVRTATTAALAATYDTGNKKLVATANGSLVIDSIGMHLNDRVLVKDQAVGSKTQNGIYYVTVIGDGTTPWELTRSADFDGSSVGEVTGGAFTFVQEGNINHDSGWVLITDDPITIDTTGLDWEQFSGAGQIIAGDGLTKTGNILNIGAGQGIEVDPDAITIALDGTTLTKSGSGVKVSSSGITATELNSSVAGAGISGGNGAALAVNTGNGLQIVSDDVTIKLNGGTLDLSSSGIKVAAGGITTTELAAGSVTDVKLNASIAGAGLIGAAGSPLAVGAGDGITVNVDDVAVNTSAIIDTTKGLASDGSNNIFVNLDANGGLEFNGGAIRFKASVAGDGLAINNGVLSVNTGSGTQISGDQIILGPLTSNWNTYNNATHYTITGLADPTNPSDAATMSWTQTQISNAAANSAVVDTFTLSATNITNKYVTLTGTPKTAADVTLSIKNAPGQFYGEDFEIDAVNTNRLSWAGMGLDGLLESGDKLTIVYTVAV
jgi:hypothetical protein